MQALRQINFLGSYVHLTVNNNRFVQAVDYVQGMLLNQPCGTLQRIIDDLIYDLSIK